MTQINLLPWREQARQVKKIQFAIMGGVFFAFAIFLVLITHIFVAGLISSQQSYNDFLQTQLNNEQSNLLTLNKDKKEQNEILKQVQFLSALRDQSYQTVRLLNELPRIVPDTVLLLKLTKNNDQISISGLAQSNFQISLLMENMSKSKIFNQPTLNKISEGNQANSSGENFEINVTQRE